MLAGSFSSGSHGAAPGPWSQPQPAPPATARRWILVADDDRGVRALLGRVLTNAGYAVVTARDGVEACELVADVVPDLIILDLRMPRMSGVQFLAHARRIPVVVLSGFLGDLPPEAESGPNIVARLEKPVSLETLRATVKRALAGGRRPLAP